LAVFFGLFDETCKNPEFEKILAPARTDEMYLFKRLKAHYFPDQMRMRSTSSSEISSLRRS